MLTVWVLTDHIRIHRRNIHADLQDKAMRIELGKSRVHTAMVFKNRKRILSGWNASLPAHTPRSGNSFLQLGQLGTLAALGQDTLVFPHELPMDSPASSQGSHLLRECVELFEAAQSPQWASLQLAPLDLLLTVLPQGQVPARAFHPADRLHRGHYGV